VSRSSTGVQEYRSSTEVQMYYKATEVVHVQWEQAQHRSTKVHE
jgi:hypothetical protein